MLFFFVLFFSMFFLNFRHAPFIYSTPSDKTSVQSPRPPSNTSLCKRCEVRSRRESSDATRSRSFSRCCSCHHGAKGNWRLGFYVSTDLAENTLRESGCWVSLGGAARLCLQNCNAKGLGDGQAPASSCSLMSTRSGTVMHMLFVVTK